MLKIKKYLKRLCKLIKQISMYSQSQNLKINPFLLSAPKIIPNGILVPEIFQRKLFDFVLRDAFEILTLSNIEATAIFDFAA